MLSSVLVAVLVGLGVAGYDCLLRVDWVGAFPLRVQLNRKGPRLISRISAQALMASEWAEELRIDPRRLELDLKPVPWVEGQPFTVQVPSSGRMSGFGRDLSYFNFQLLVLRIEYADGTSEYVTADIPDGRVKREVFVVVP
jgi:hypothetical protein